jgi:hypothetical protein
MSASPYTWWRYTDELWRSMTFVTPPFAERDATREHEDLWQDGHAATSRTVTFRRKRLQQG